VNLNYPFSPSCFLHDLPPGTASLCNLGVLCVSVVCIAGNHHGDTENTKVTQRNLKQWFSVKLPSLPADPIIGELSANRRRP
jgi:hypothetical protein